MSLIDQILWPPDGLSFDEWQELDCGYWSDRANVDATIHVKGCQGSGHYLCRQCKSFRSGQTWIKAPLPTWLDLAVQRLGEDEVRRRLEAGRSLK